MSNITLLKIRLQETFAKVTEMHIKHQKAERRCRQIQKNLNATRRENYLLKNIRSENEMKIQKLEQIIAEQMIEIRDMKVSFYIIYFTFISYPDLILTLKRFHFFLYL